MSRPLYRTEWEALDLLLTTGERRPRWSRPMAPREYALAAAWRRGVLSGYETLARPVPRPPEVPAAQRARDLMDALGVSRPPALPEDL